jgi:hypothetical protein
MKIKIYLFYLSFIAMFFFNAQTLLAQRSPKLGIAVNGGWFHTFNRAPALSNDSDFKDTYYLKERRALSVDFYRSAFFRKKQSQRFGIRIRHLSVRRHPQENAHISEQGRRLYNMSALGLIYQRKLYEKNRLQIALDLSSGVSFMQSESEELHGDYCDTFMCPTDVTTQVGFQVGFVYLIRIKEDLGIKLTSCYHLYTGEASSPSFPFSSGIILEIGVVLQG